MLSSSLRRSSSSSRNVVLSLARRSFAAEAQHKPPLDLHGLQARYANATYVAASKAGALDKVEQELIALQETASKNKQFADFLQNPLIGRDSKIKQVENMLKGKFSPTTLNLMTTLAGNARLSELDKITSTYVELMKAKRGQVEAVIISSEPLSKQQTDAVASAMKSQVPAGKQVVLSTKVDPTILGGLQVQIGDQFLDLSVASKIDEISRISV
jgi:F-type H+-transporting ATPase subunit O